MIQSSSNDLLSIYKGRKCKGGILFYPAMHPTSPQLKTEQITLWAPNYEMELVTILTDSKWGTWSTPNFQVYARIKSHSLETERSKEQHALKKKGLQR